MIKFATVKDKKELSSLWQMTFSEDSSVIESFFENVFQDTVAPVIRLDGEIISSLFLLDCKIGDYNGKCIYCAMTKYAHRGKGYMKKLLDFSYAYCKKNGFDFLFLVPAEESLFDYYRVCGFENFGISRAYTINDTIPQVKELLKYDCQIEFDNSVIKYWENSCIAYDGEVNSFGLIFPDDETVIRNAKGNYEDIPENNKKTGTIIKGDITFGNIYSPAMIKTEDNNIKKLICYIGVTLE